jgi:hypothetical protein
MEAIGDGPVPAEAAEERALGEQHDGSGGLGGVGRTTRTRGGVRRTRVRGESAVGLEQSSDSNSGTGIRYPIRRVRVHGRFFTCRWHPYPTQIETGTGRVFFSTHR